MTSTLADIADPATYARNSKCQCREARTCRSCTLRRLNADPAFRAKKLEQLRIRAADPEYRRRMSQRMIVVTAERMKDPAYAEMRRQQGHAFGAKNFDKGRADPAVRRKVGQTLTNQRLAWCPPERRAFYQVLRKRHGATTAREMIERELLAVRIGSLIAHVADAAEHLKRHASPVYDRGKVIGKAHAGTFQVGTRVLSTAEVVTLAQAKGWQPDEWRRVA
jgi:hypothetical protein